MQPTQRPTSAFHDLRKSTAEGGQVGCCRLENHGPSARRDQVRRRRRCTGVATTALGSIGRTSAHRHQTLRFLWPGRRSLLLGLPPLAPRCRRPRLQRGATAHQPFVAAEGNPSTDACGFQVIGPTCPETARVCRAQAGPQPARLNSLPEPNGLGTQPVRSSADASDWSWDQTTFPRFAPTASRTAHTRTHLCLHAPSNRPPQSDLTAQYEAH